VSIDRRKAAETALAAAREASALIMQVYATPFDVDFKVGDDPVTRADREANTLICERLGRAYPGLPIVAEESDPATYAGFGSADAAWFVDPLDGTREFVARNGEFSVMVGLAEAGRAIVGVVVAPAWQRTFFGVVGEGAWEVDAEGARTRIRVSSRATTSGAIVVASRSRMPPLVTRVMAALGTAPPRAHGSSGLKGALVSTADADIYLQPGAAGMRWDACATDALVHAAGGRMTQADGTSFDYASGEVENRRGMVATNGLLHDAVIEALRQAGPGDA
jgi:3'(2'), 5'-bisphosphate nucleotidase